METVGSQILLTASALIIAVLGALHLFFTFFGTRLAPRDPALTDMMKQTSPIITGQTTMWQAWIGFNASHAMGAILFGLIYGYLAVIEPTIVFGSMFLGGIGLAFLAGYVFLGYRYWFSTPFRGIAVATVCYAAAFALRVVA